MTGPRVALVGARRARRGLGPFVARDLHRAGAVVAGFVGTTDETVAAAERDLRERLGLEVRGYRGLEDLIARERPDALAILSPAETHETYLRAALAADLPVLCEKPLIWGGEGLARRAAEIVEAFARRGLLLRETCQWPCVLPAYRELHPESPPGPPATFAMRLSPESPGREMIGDSMPHPLSLLQALAPGPDARLTGVRLAFEGAGAGPPSRLQASFQYRAGGTEIAAEVRLESTRAVPKPAAFALDGRWAHRIVELPAYTILLKSGARCVKVADPLEARIRAFAGELAAALAGRAPAPDEAIGPRMAMLERLWLASGEGGRS